MERNCIIELDKISVYHARKPHLNLNKKKAYKGGQLVLKDVDFRVYEGDLVYFVGRVGSGKSTLLKTIYGEIPLVEGRACVAGFDLGGIRRRDIPRLRREMGIVFQDYQLLADRSVYENLRFVLRAIGKRNELEIKDKITEALQVVGLSNKEYKMPFELSGGEQQRLSIARAILNEPKVLIADEPTGNLDPQAADEIMKLFFKIAREKCAVIMSTHNVRTIQQYPSRIMRFAGGRVEEVDTRSIFGQQ